jgi:hypothetical protein
MLVTEKIGVSFEGGVLGGIIEDVAPSIKAAQESKRKIVAGTVLSGAGAAAQILAGFGQALHWLP